MLLYNSVSIINCNRACYSLCDLLVVHLLTAVLDVYEVSTPLKPFLGLVADFG